MDFQRITFDADVDELEADEARELVSKFDSAQTENITAFEEASEKIEDLDGDLSEFEDADEDLTEDVVEATFLDEEEASALSFARKREVLAEFEEQEAVDDEGDEGDEGGEGNFNDMGTRGETHNEEEAQEAFAEKHLGDISGLNF
jgi:hypothetical protein